MCSPSPSSAAVLFNLTSVSSPTAGEGQTLPIATSYPLNVAPQFNASTLNFDSRVQCNAAADGRAAELFGERLQFPTAALLTHQQAYALAVGGQVRNQCGGVRFENATDPTFNSLLTTATTNNDLQQPSSSFYEPHHESIAAPPFYAPPAGVTLCHPVYGVIAREVATNIGGDSNNCGPLISSTSQLLNELDDAASTSLQPGSNNRLLLGELPEAPTLETIYPARSHHAAAIDHYPLTAPYPFGDVANGCSGVEVGGDQLESAVAQALPPSSPVIPIEKLGSKNGSSSDATASRKRNGKEVVVESLRKWRKRKNAGQDGRSNNNKDKKAARRDTTADHHSSTSLPDAAAGNRIIPNESISTETQATGSTTGLLSTQPQRQRRVELNASEVERRRQQLLVSREPPTCAGCAQLVRDRTLLILMGDNDPCYHDACLKCSVCELALMDFPTCYVKESTIYCRSCYSSKFHATKCTSCERQIQPTDWVRRARDFLYHLACFACQHCKRQLSTGEEFSLQDNDLLCRQHYLELVQGEDCGSKQKMKRVRTTFAEEQIGILQTHFQIDSNPDGADLERIANLTGLSKRVTQVWFQNNRARQKKYQGAGSSTVRSRSRQTNNNITNSTAQLTEAHTSRNNTAGEETSETPLPPPYSSPDASSNDEAQRISNHSSTLSN